MADHEGAKVPRCLVKCLPICAGLQYHSGLGPHRVRQGARAKLVEGVNKLKLKLDNESYVQRAPAEVVQKDRERLSEAAAELERTDKHLAEIRKLAK